VSAPLVLENGLVDVRGGEFRRGDLAMADGRIVAAAPEGAERIDCSRFLVVPGMINAHNHSNENWFRGMWDNLPLEPWMLFSYPALAAPAQSPDEIYLRTLLGAIEQLRSGATCVVDFLYELDGFTDETLAAVVRAYRDVGLRAPEERRPHHGAVRIQLRNERIVHPVVGRIVGARRDGEVGVRAGPPRHVQGAVGAERHTVGGVARRSPEEARIDEHRGIDHERTGRVVRADVESVRPSTHDERRGDLARSLA
jgi:hypothetical protein